MNERLPANVPARMNANTANCVRKLYLAATTTRATIILVTLATLATLAALAMTVPAMTAAINATIATDPVVRAPAPTAVTVVITITDA